MEEHVEGFSWEMSNLFFEKGKSYLETSDHIKE